jgi:hypothetical protein
MGAAGQGAWECTCHRWYKGFPENGQTITHILVWEPGNNTLVATYRVRVEAPNQSPNH